jgi:hypothetical protein
MATQPILCVSSREPSNLCTACTDLCWLPLSSLIAPWNVTLPDIHHKVISTHSCENCMFNTKSRSSKFYILPLRMFLKESENGSAELPLALNVTFLVGFEALTAVVMKSTHFWHITPCSPLSVNRHFGGTYRLHLQGRKNKSSNKPARK